MRKLRLKDKQLAKVPFPWFLVSSSDRQRLMIFGWYQHAIRVTEFASRLTGKECQD